MPSRQAGPKRDQGSGTDNGVITQTQITASSSHSGEPFEKAPNVTLDPVVFRSSGQDRTTAGAYIEMASHLTEPVLLGLPVRNRVKR